MRHGARRQRTRYALGCAAVLAVIAAAPADAAVYNVSNTNDVPAQNPASGSCATAPASPAGGACTLRSAIQAANNVAGLNDINVAAGTYVLTIAPSGTNDDSTGDLNVTNTSGKLRINGAGPGTSGTIVDGNFTDRIFDLATGTDVEIKEMRLRNGRTGGLGNVTSCPSGGGGVDAHGGAVQTNGALALANDVITGNMTTGHGGGVVHFGDGTMTVTQTTFSGNISCAGDSGSHAGGGLAIFGFGTPTINIDLSTFTGNSADGSGIGGGAAIFLDAFVARSTFSGNDAENGGGIATQGEGPKLDLFADTLSSNTARQNGSALSVVGSQVTVVNSTLSGNIGPGAIGAGSGFTTISFSTLTNGEGNILNFDSGNFSVDNSIVTGSPGSNCNGSFSAGNNLFDDDGTSCGAVASDIKNTNPMLGPLKNNGGPTETRALQLGSKAIDAADDGRCSEIANSVDQRAVTRPQGPHCDIGAFEFQSADLVLTASAAKSTINVGEKDTVTDVVTNKGPSTATNVQFSQAASSGYTINSVTSSQGTCTHTAKTVNCNLGSIALNGKVTIKIVLTGNSPGVITLKSSVKGARPDPTPANNNATVRITVRQPPKPGCVDKRSFTFKFPSDSEDRNASDSGDFDEGRVVTVKIYDNGKRVDTRHGHDIKKVTIDPPPKQGTHEIKVVGILNNGFKIKLIRTYHGCANSSTRVEIVRPRKRDDSP